MIVSFASGPKNYQPQSLARKKRGGEDGTDVRVRSGLLHNSRSWVGGMRNECTIGFGSRF